MDQTYDAIVIGAGHNGLVTASLLGKAGLKVLVLEQRPRFGGLASSEEAFPGYNFNVGAQDIGLLLPAVSKALGLDNANLTTMEGKAAVFAPHRDGSSLTLWSDPMRSVEEISRRSASDGAQFGKYVANMKRMDEIVAEILTRTPPDLPDYSLSDLWTWAPLGLKLRRMDEGQMMGFLRTVPLNARDLLNEWFEDPFLKGMLAVPGISGGMPGPYQSGTAYMLLYQRIGTFGGYRSRRFVKGGLGKLAEALVATASSFGVELRSGVEVREILLDDDWEGVVGVKLADDEELPARLVISNADPRQTFFELVGGGKLEPRFVRELTSTAYGGGIARVNLALSDLPDFGGRAQPEQLDGYTVISPDLAYMEKAWDDAKYGRFSRRPVLESIFPSILDPDTVPAGRHSMSVTVYYAPYILNGSDWGSERDKLGDTVMETLESVAPELPELVVDRQVITPLDWEKGYRLTEGHVFHGQMRLDQLFFMRPMPGYAGYRTPFRGLYLCGSGTHPGGGVTGAPGFNAARVIARDWKK